MGADTRTSRGKRAVSYTEFVVKMKQVKLEKRRLPQNWTQEDLDKLQEFAEHMPGYHFIRWYRGSDHKEFIFQRRRLFAAGPFSMAGKIVHDFYKVLNNNEEYYHLIIGEALMKRSYDICADMEMLCIEQYIFQIPWEED